MLFVPWRHVTSWRCIACGKCCKLYSVVLSFPEWLRILRNYGVGKTISDIDRLLIKRRTDGSCTFLHSFSSMCLCSLQYMKPKACKLWPFKILSKPKYGHADEAIYHYGRGRLFLYADSSCNGLIYGRPTEEFVGQTLKEFVEIAFDHRNSQVKTTANFSFLQPHPRRV